MLLKNLVSPETVPSLAVFAGHGVSFGEQIKLSQWWRFVWKFGNLWLRFPDQRISFGETSPKFEPWRTKGENVFFVGKTVIWKLDVSHNFKISWNKVVFQSVSY